MSPEPWRERVEDMIADAERICAFIGSEERSAFVNDEKSVFAVCYAFVRLGEAARHIPPEIVAAHPEVEWGDIKHFRNFMIHVYPSVDPGRLFDTAKIDLPPLIEKLRGVLGGA